MRRSFWTRPIGVGFHGKRPTFVLRQNVGLMLSCFCFAIILWMYVAGLEPDPELSHSVSRAVSVQVTPAHARLPVLLTDPPTVTVIMQSFGSLPEHPSLQATVDLGLIGKTGHYPVPVNVESTGPADTNLHFTVSPPYVNIFLDDISSQPTPVAFHTVRHPANGYVAGSPVIDPDVVSVSGPTSLLPRVHLRAVLDLTNVTDDIDTMIPVQFSGVEESEEELFSVKPEKVHLYLPVQHALAYGTVAVSPRFSGSPAAGFQFQRAEISPPTVTVSGPPAAVQALGSMPTVPISLAGARGSFVARAMLAPPLAVHVEGQAMVQVAVTLGRAAAKTGAGGPPGNPSVAPAGSSFSSPAFVPPPASRAGGVRSGFAFLRAPKYLAIPPGQP